jgi:hypothetical protein
MGGGYCVLVGKWRGGGGGGGGGVRRKVDGQRGGVSIRNRTSQSLNKIKLQQQIQRCERSLLFWKRGGMEEQKIARDR